MFKKTKKLNLKKMWKLYLLLHDVIVHEELEEDFSNFVILAFDILSPEALLECMYLMYDNKLELDDKSGLDLLEDFSLRLRQNNFAEFVLEIRKWI